MALIPRHRVFVAEYLKELNGKKAAIKAGFSRKTAEAQASRLLRNVEVKEAVQAGLKRLEDKAEVTAEEILRELCRIAFLDIRKAYNELGGLKPIHEMPEDVARAIAGIEVDELFEGVGQDREQVGVTKKVRFWDKPRSLELLGKHLKMWVDRHHITAGAKLEDLVAGSQEETTAA